MHTGSSGSRAVRASKTRSWKVSSRPTSTKVVTSVTTRSCFAVAGRRRTESRARFHALLASDEGITEVRAEIRAGRLDVPACRLWSLRRGQPGFEAQRPGLTELARNPGKQADVGSFRAP